MDSLDKFEPFGVENPEPKFLLKNCIIKEISTMGADKSHLRITLEQNGIIKEQWDLVLQISFQI